MVHHCQYSCTSRKDSLGGDCWWWKLNWFLYNVVVNYLDMPSISELAWIWSFAGSTIMLWIVPYWYNVDVNTPSRCTCWFSFDILMHCLHVTIIAIPAFVIPFTYWAPFILGIPSVHFYDYRVARRISINFAQIEDSVGNCKKHNVQRCSIQASQYLLLINWTFCMPLIR